MVNRSPFAITQHPFSFSFSAEADDGRVEVSVKALGDFTSTVHAIAAGTRAYVDRPHGVFTPDRFEGPGFVLIGGGIGITPLVSMLRTLADRDDRRPCLLLYANPCLEEATFREELEALERRLALRVVHVVEDAPDGWPGGRGASTTSSCAATCPSATGACSTSPAAHRGCWTPWRTPSGTPSSEGPGCATSTPPAPSPWSRCS
jgi:predicted ferric reductase